LCGSPPRLAAPRRGQCLVNSPWQTGTKGGKGGNSQGRRLSQQRKLATNGKELDLNRTQEVAGSSPASSTTGKAWKRGPFVFTVENEIGPNLARGQVLVNSVPHMRSLYASVSTSDRENLYMQAGSRPAWPMQGREPASGLLYPQVLARDHLTLWVAQFDLDWLIALTGKMDAEVHESRSLDS
jgi:hypothetical protein